MTVVKMGEQNMLFDDFVKDQVKNYEGRITEVLGEENQWTYYFEFPDDDKASTFIYMIHDKLKPSLFFDSEESPHRYKYIKPKYT